MEITVHIRPIKALYRLLEAGRVGPHTAAVLCTTGTVDADRLAGITWLHIPFADVTDEARPDAFQPRQGRQIRSFVDGLRGITDLYFCCDSGESRSTALAAAFLHYLGQDEMAVWKNVRYHPNELVYYLQSAACGLEITRQDARELAEYNQMLFRRAISGTK